MHHCSRSHGRARLYFYTVLSLLADSPSDHRRTNGHTAIHTKTTENKGDSHRSPVAIKSRKGQGAEFHLRDDDDVVGEGRPPVVRRAVPRRARACLPRIHTRHTQHPRRSVPDLGPEIPPPKRSNQHARFGPSEPEKERERESKGRDPHGDGVRGGAGRRGGVQVPQQDPLPVDGLLHCLTPFLGCSLLVTTCCRRYYRPRGGSGVICRRGGDCRGGWTGGEGKSRRFYHEVLGRRADGKPETRPGGMGTGGVSRGGPARQRRLGLELLLRYCVSA